MAQTKNALIRQRVIDRCLGGPKLYSIKEIMEKCNIALEEAGYKPVTSKVTILKDIDDIELNFPDAVIVREKRSRNVYYYYENKPFSIYKIPLNDNQMAQLAQTISILSKFEGMPNFDWLDDFIEHFKSSLNIPNTKDTIVMFDENLDYEGRNYFSELFSAIASQQALEITYQPFGKAERVYQFHPYLLKQYNNRWFLFGSVDGYDTLTNFPLDRIKEISPATIPYKPNTNIDFQEYFDEMVGVSRNKNEISQIQIKVDKALFPYIETKPIHGTQKVVKRDDDGVIIQIEVITNRELLQLLQSYGSGITILNPAFLQETIINELNKTLEKYQSVQLD